MLKRYAVPRYLYHRLFKPELVVQRRENSSFFAQFASAGDTVFDIGAGRGEISEALAACGARVIAVEPNPMLADRLRKRFNVEVEEVAVGPKSGTALLRLGRYWGHSTLSDQWAGITGPDRFVGEISVDVLTFDQLIARHGTPEYVKIDVEGSEADVFSGLSQPIRCISFEFQCAAVDIAERALAKLGVLGRYEFNLTLLEEHVLVSAVWMRPGELFEHIGVLASENSSAYGDVYARLIDEK